jgi:hypothetical protein
MKQLGQYYTHKNIFNHPAFLAWFNAIPSRSRQNVLEPFAGKNSIIHMLNELNLITGSTSYDIEPLSDEVIYRDTLNDFPQNHDVIITNPPFLAKNVATKLGVKITIDPYADLYELCLNRCLQNASYVAAIIPESFIVSDFFKNRLICVISLAQKKIFKNTEHPVCLALFVPENSILLGEKDSDCYSHNYAIYSNEHYVGQSQSLIAIEKDFLSRQQHSYQTLWHQPQGQVGLIAIDATDKKKNISFIYGDDILPEDVTPYSRLRTRIDVLNHKGRALSKTHNQKLLRMLNQVLKEYRELTHDVFLTSFKGLRADGKYRRRLDFNKARLLTNVALSRLDSGR